MTPDNAEQRVVMLFTSATASGAVPAFGSYIPLNNPVKLRDTSSFSG
jgi:hypothetical protein